MSKFWQIATSLAAAAALSVPASFAQPAPQSAPAQAPRTHSAGAGIQQVPYLGVAGEDLDADRRQALKVKEDHGIVVTMVSEGAAAEKAGLKKGDVILEYNGHAVESFEQLRGLIQDSPAGKPVKVVISRNGAVQTLSAVPELRRVVMIPGMEVPIPMTPMPMPAPMPPMMPEIPRFQTVVPNTPLGILGEDLIEEPQFADFFGVKDGVLVKSIAPNSLAERAGIRIGDVLTKVDDRRVSSSRELQRAVRSASAKSSYQLTVVRNRKETVLNVTP